MTIIAAAKRQGEVIVSLPNPARHSDLSQLSRDHFSIDYHAEPIEDGFLDDTGTFLTRHEALIHFIRWPQMIISNAKSIDSKTTELYTVHLW